MLKRIDYYIIKKVLGTYVLSILMIISIAIVIDITEKMDDFYQAELSLQTIVMQYYIHFVPYYINLFSSLFTFISVIFVTSKLAYNSEIIAMLAGGISFRRIMVPFFISAMIIALFTFYIGSYVIPKGNNIRLAFESQYIDHSPPEVSLRNVQFKINQSDIAYMERFNVSDEIGYRFSLDSFQEKRLAQRITAQTIRYKGDKNWLLLRYTRREFDGLTERLGSGDTLRLHLDMEPKDFLVVKNQQERLTNPELLEYIDENTKRGRAGLNAYKLEYQKRFALPFGSFVLTLIGASLSAKKVRGGKGFNLFIGLLLSVVYILCTLVSSTFTVKAGINPTLAIWLPNLVFLCIGIWLYRIAPK